MAKLLRLYRPRGQEARRWTIGLEVSSDGARVAGTLIQGIGTGLDLRVEAGRPLVVAVPPETVSLFAPLAQPGSRPEGPDSACRLALLRLGLAEIQAAMVAELLAKSKMSPSEVLAVGVHDPGLWSHGPGAPWGYLGLSDAARLAELTGLNTIDAFAGRDVARGGQGGPITALAEWVLIRSAGANRGLLDLGRSVRMTYLPRAAGPKAASAIRAFDIGPGMLLLDVLTRRLTHGEARFDAGGRLAVQGKRVPELVAHWLADPYFGRPLPRWSPWGVRPERFLNDALQMAVRSGWSVRDLLCSATHFIAEAIASAIQHRLPEGSKVDEMVLTGGGQHNGLLLREIAARLPGTPLIRGSDLGFGQDVLGPASIAVLALFLVDQVPANHPAVTGTEVSRVLGRLTPGSPQSWQKMTESLRGSRPGARPLRSAL